MTVSINNQAFIFLCSVAGGMAIALIYDFFRISRKAIRTGTLLTFAEDLLFWLIVAIVMFLTVYFSNDGELRSYIFLGAVIGTVLYALLFSKAVMNSSLFIINLVRKVLRAIFFVLFLPFKFIFKVLSIPAGYISKGTGKALTGIRRVGRNRMYMASVWRRIFKNLRKKV